MSNSDTSAQSGPDVSPVEYIDVQAPFQVITRTLVAGTAAAGVGSLIGLRRNIPAIPAAFTTALSTSVFAFAFFSLREYLAVPTTRYLQTTGSVSSIPNPHTSNLVQTGLSGAGAGALLLGYARGRKNLFPGALTFALGCSALQLAINELYLARLSFLSRPDTAASDVITTASSTSPGIKDKILSYVPVRKVDDKEYAASLKKQLEECSSAIAEVDTERAKLKANPHAHKV